MRLKDKVVIVTGGGIGIGRAYSLGLAREGARVVVADIADPKPTVKEIEAGGGQALAVECDVSREAETLRMAAETVNRFGRIDVLINNAAIYAPLQRRSFMEIPVEEWDRVMAVNLRGLFLCARAVFPAMKAQGKGKIINISSGTFFKGIPHFIHYTTSKGGVVGFTRSLAREFAADGIRINGIAPGPIATAMVSREHMSDEWMAKELAIPMARLGTPEEVAAAIVFLLSPQASYFTGQLLGPNGGSWMGA